MIFAAVAGHRSGRALPSLRDARQRQSMERIGRESIYRDRNAVQTKPATSPGVHDNRLERAVKVLGHDINRGDTVTASPRAPTSTA